MEQKIRTLIEKYGKSDGVYKKIYVSVKSESLDCLSVGFPLDAEDDYGIVSFWQNRNDTESFGHYFEFVREDLQKKIYKDILSQFPNEEIVEETEETTDTIECDELETYLEEFMGQYPYGDSRDLAKFFYEKGYLAGQSDTLAQSLQ